MSTPTTGHVVFVQGGGAGAHDADVLMASSLRAHLGEGFTVDYPRMPDEDDPDYRRWSPALGEAIGKATPPTVLVGHSVGGYLLLKYLAETRPASPIRAVCVIAAPFPGSDADWTFDGFELPAALGEKLPPGAEVFLYASEDDEVVPFAHRDLYAAAIPGAVTRTTTGGHQLDNDLGVVARDIRALFSDARMKGTS
jgi:uncharacterized protein